MTDLIKEKEEICLCNQELEAKLIFTTVDSAKNWMDKQAALHGKAPDLILARRITRVVTEVI